MSSFTIQTQAGEKKIGDNAPCFVIAEMSGNHNQNLDKAKAIVKAAKAAGADAVKLQTYTPDTLTIDSDKTAFMVRGANQPDLWKGEKLYDLYKTAYTPWAWFAELKQLIEDEGMVFFSTPYDDTAVDFLEQLGCPMYKVASYEATDYLLLRKLAKTDKPILLSVGFATLEEVELAIKTLRDNGCKDLAVLYCVTAYSDNPRLEDSNLKTMLDIESRFKVVPGFSDNNAGVEIPVTAAIMGAKIIEKHVIIDRGEGGPDSRFSVQPEELKETIEKIRRAEKIMGKVNYGVQNILEEQNTFFRRSLFVVKDVKAGDQVTKENVRSIRPSAGMPSKHYDQVMGKKFTKDVERGTPLQFVLLQ